MICIDIEEWSDSELSRAWDYLETLTLSDYVKQKMDEISNEIDRRAGAGVKR